MFYRDIYFNEPEKIFGSILMGELFNRIFIPLFYLLLILSIVRVDYRKKNIFMGFGCLIFLSYITQGRFPIYHMLYFALIFLIINGLNIKIKNLMYLSLSSMLIVFIALALFISRLEIDLSLMNIEFMIDLFLKYFINYHFVGLYIFDSILENSMYATRTFYGCNSIGFVGDIARRIEEIFIGTQTINDCYRANNDFFLQGQYIEGLDGRYNAFGTNMMPLYLDGGWVGVLSFSSLLGFLCAKMKCPEEMVVNPIFLLINFVVVFGAFQSLISDPIFQATLIIFFFYNYLIKFINKLYDV
jgi:oligosaccharide repeat unit polymerase